LAAAAFVNQLWYFLSLAATVLIMAVFFAEVLNRHRQRKNLDSNGDDGGDNGAEPPPAAPDPAPSAAQAEPLAPELPSAEEGKTGAEE